MTTSHNHNQDQNQNPNHDPLLENSSLEKSYAGAHGTTQLATFNDHWGALTAVLPEDSVAQLDSWFDDQLRQLEQSQERFVTKQSLRKNLRG